MVKVRVVLSLLKGLVVANFSLHSSTIQSNTQFGKNDFLIVVGKIKRKKVNRN